MAAEIERTHTPNKILCSKSTEHSTNIRYQETEDDSSLSRRSETPKEVACAEDESSDNDFDDCQKDLSNEVSKPRAPDGGFGWFIVLGCFIAHVVFGGLDRSEGVFFLLLTSQFGESAQLTSWPGAIASTLQLALGPLANVLSFRYSARVSVFFGSVLMFLGFVLNSFATNIYFYFISHSLIDGIGRGIAYVPGLIMVGMYFDKRAGLATGLATSGSGIGTFLIVPLSQYLADNYGFQGTFLVLGGFASHMFIAAMLYRPLSVHYQSMKEANRSGTQVGVYVNGVIDKEETMVLNERESCDDSKSEDGNVRESFEISNIIIASLEPQYILHSLKSETCQSITHSPKSETCQNITHSPKSETCQNVTHSLKSEICQSVTHSPKSETCQSVTHSPKSETCQNVTPSLKSETCKRMANSPKNESSTNKPARQRVKDPSCLKSSFRICFPVEHTNRQPTNFFRLDLLTKPAFLMYCLSILTFTMAFRAAFTFIPALMESKGIPKWESALALSSAGAVDTFGRIGAGFLLDLPKLRPVRLVLYNMVIFGVSLVAFILPSLSTISSFCVTSSFYGLLTGAYISQKSVVLADILDLKDIASSFGILMVFQGLGSLLGPPLSGAFKDAFGDFEKSFYLGGGLLIVSGFLMILCNIFNILQTRKEGVKDTPQVASKY